MAPRRRKDPEETPEAKRARFLDALSQGHSVTSASKAAGFARQRAYQMREQDEDFAKAWDDAIEAGTDLLEDEALRRAMKGTARPVFHRGEKCGQITEYSDTLTIVLLKARRPEKYKDRVQSDSSVNLGGATVQVYLPANGRDG